MYHSTNTLERAITDPNDDSPDHLPTTPNQAINSVASGEGNTMDRRTLWVWFGFTDEIDRRDFGKCWDAVEKLKYNNPTLKSLRSVIPTNSDQCFCKEAWIRLGWYLAKNDFIEIVICKRSVTDEIVKFMFGSVIWTPKKRIKAIDILHCQITSDGIMSLLPFIKMAPNVTSIYMDGNEIGTGGLGLVAKALCGRPIEILSFQNSTINNIVPALTGCKFPELEEFHLRNNPIGDEGAKFISGNFLQSSPKLKILGLENCGIGDQGAESIASELVSNISLTTLWLGCNNITDKGVTSFAEALRSNHDLRFVQLDGVAEEWSDMSTQQFDLQFALKMNNYMQEEDLEQARWMKETYFAKGGDGLECTVCLEKKSAFFFFLPCGHKICTDCNDDYDKDICHMCNKTIEKRQRLY